MAQYKLAHIDMKGNRGELHDLLNLTGAEVSCNTLPAGASVQFAAVSLHVDMRQFVLSHDSSPI